MLSCLCPPCLSVCLFIAPFPLISECILTTSFVITTGILLACFHSTTFVFVRINGLVATDGSKCLVTLPISSMIKLVIQNGSFSASWRWECEKFEVKVKI